MQCQLPLVGNPAPDFEAEAVFDQEFINVIILVGLKFMIKNTAHLSANRRTWMCSLIAAAVVTVII